MPVRVKLPTQLRDAAGGEGTIEAEGETVGAVLDDVFATHGELRGRLTDDAGALRRFVNVYLDGDDIRYGEGLETAVRDGQELQVLPAVAGG